MGEIVEMAKISELAQMKKIAEMTEIGVKMGKGIKWIKWLKTWYALNCRYSKNDNINDKMVERIDWNTTYNWNGWTYSNPQNFWMAQIADTAELTRMTVI